MYRSKWLVYHLYFVRVYHLNMLNKIDIYCNSNIFPMPSIARKLYPCLHVRFREIHNLIKIFKHKDDKNAVVRKICKFFNLLLIVCNLH